MRHDSAQILFQAFLQEAIVSSSGVGRDVHSLTLSSQYLLSQPQYCPLLHGALKDGLGEAVMVRVVLKEAGFSSGVPL